MIVDPYNDESVNGWGRNSGVAHGGDRPVEIALVTRVSAWIDARSRRIRSGPFTALFRRIAVSFLRNLEQFVGTTLYVYARKRHGKEFRLHPYFRFFYERRPFIPHDPSEWPASWRTIRWKSYPENPQHRLPAPHMPDASFPEVLLRRRSSKQEFTAAPLSSREFSNVLFYAAGVTMTHKDPNLTRRPYPSSGALYPIELYPVVFYGTTEVPSGVYHYNIRSHALEKLQDDVERLRSAFHYQWAARAAMVLIFTFIEERSVLKYGTLAYKTGLIEAGHIGQNIYLNCAALGLKCCALGHLDPDVVHRALQLDGFREVAFYAIAVGR